MPQDKIDTACESGELGVLDSGYVENSQFSDSNLYSVK